MVRFERHNYREISDGFEVGARIFRTFDLIFVHNGVAELKIGSHRVRLSKGRAILVYPQTLFNQGSVGGVCLLSGQHFSIDANGAHQGPILSRLVGKEDGFELAQQTFSERDEWDILRALQMATLEQTPVIEEMRVAQLILILARWLPAPLTVHAGNPHAREIRKLVEWLENNIDKPITSDQMAGRIGLSSGQFRQQFKDQIGSTPMQFFLQLRMDACKRLLLESDAGIKSVAQAVGFSDLPHFYRNFKKHTRKTPDQFRHDPLPRAM